MTNQRSQRSLLGHYRHIGIALLEHESRPADGPSRMLIPTRDVEEAFGANLATVPVEVMESYLDDLLDLNVTDESLFIKRVESDWRGSVIALLLACSAAVSLYAPFDAAGYWVTLGLGVFFSCGLFLALYLLPRSRVMRRFGFATLISKVIARRKGYDGNSTTSLTPRIIRDLFGGRRQLALGAQAAPFGSAARSRALRYFH